MRTGNAQRPLAVTLRACLPAALSGVVLATFLLGPPGAGSATPGDDHGAGVTGPATTHPRSFAGAAFRFAGPAVPFARATLPLAVAAVPPSGIGDSLSAAVDELFAAWHRPDSPGAAVLVMRDGAVVHRRGYGMASLEHGVRIGPHTVFDVASVSKQFAAFAVALLEADGVLSIDDDVRDHIPELPDFGHLITLRHLIHHTSGIRDWPGSLRMAGWSYEDVLSFDQILRMSFWQEDLNFVPGEAYAYSNTGYNLLAEVVSRASGHSFREFCEERIFGPLGMTRTHFRDDHSEVILDLAESYRPGPNGTFRRVPSSLTAWGSSSLHTSVDDMALWIANFGAPRVGGREVVSRMEERGVLTGGDTIDYAWGQNVVRTLGLPSAVHGGSWAGYRSVLLRFPQDGLAIAILSNVSNMDPARLARDIAELYLGDRAARAVAEGTEQSAPETHDWWPTPEELAEYPGVYSSPELDTSYRLEIREGILVAQHFRTGATSLQPVEPDRFRGAPFGEIHFQRDAEGGIIGFTANQTRISGLRFEKRRD
jgi:CubicO group peptidase (beta-lactamase class C family)